MGHDDCHADGERVTGTSSTDFRESIVQLSGVSLGYNSPFLTGVNLEIHKGDFWGIVGPNGAGKTTLAKTLLGILPPLAGTVEWSSGCPALSYTPQRHKLDSAFPLSVLDVALMGRDSRLRPGGKYSKQDKNRVQEELDRIGLAKEMHSSFRSLSGGQQQRVLIARALASDPDLMVLDEPAEGMDLLGAYDILAYLGEADVKSKMAVLMISHHVDDVISSVDHLCFVNKNNGLFAAGVCCDMASPGKLSQLFGREVQTHCCAGKTHVHVLGEEKSHVHGLEPHVPPAERNGA